MLIYIYSIPSRDSAYNIHNWRTASGIPLNKAKVGNCSTKIAALYNPRVGGLANGLSYKPWLDDNGVQVKDEDGNSLNLQDKMEQKWGLPKGFLTNKKTYKGQKDNFTYYQEKSWTLNEGVTVLDLAKMDDELFYYVALDSKYVANSEKEWREHKWPKALFYIAREQEDETLQYEKTSKKSKAYAALESSEMTPEHKRMFTDILGITRATSNVTNQQVHNLLFDYIDKTSFKPGSNIEKFLNLYSKISNAKGRKELKAMHLLKQAEDTGIITEKAGTYTLIRKTGPLVIGYTYGEALDFLTDPKKSSLVDDIIEDIKVKM